MFIVGATGQLLTLILTIVLPFVFLSSAFQNSAESDSLINTEVIRFVKVENAHFEKVDFISIDYFVDDSVKPPEIITVRPKILHSNSKYCRVKDIHLNHSGNKAPPVLI